MRSADAGGLPQSNFVPAPRATTLSPSELGDPHNRRYLARTQRAGYQSWRHPVDQIEPMTLPHARRAGPFQLCQGAHLRTVPPGLAPGAAGCRGEAAEVRHKGVE